MCPFRIGKCTGKLMYTRSRVGHPGTGTGQDLQRFYREEAVHEVDGIGIGLYLAREIITMQGGYILVTSEVGKVPLFRCSFHENNPAAACAGCRFFQKIIPAWILGHFCNNSVLGLYSYRNIERRYSYEYLADN